MIDVLSGDLTAILPVTCPKCGVRLPFVGVRPYYSAFTDTLVFACSCCGYHHAAVPLDRDRQADAMPPNRTANQGETPTR